MTLKRVAFAVPGKITNLTGGTIYDRRVIDALRAQGTQVHHIALPSSFPAPPPDEMAHALALLGAVPADVPLIVDGLAFGALTAQGVAGLRAPLVPLVHHPLAEESGLSQDRRAQLYHSERRNLSHARLVLVPSPHTAACLVETYAVPRHAIVVARPGTDRPRFGAAPIAPPLILSVGIQVPRKGHDILLRALAQIVDLPWQAAIVGGPLDPAYAQALTDVRATTGLQDRVTMPGQVAQDALQTYYAQASLFALATRYEGYGIVFDEALAHGLPIVSCATGAVPDTVPKDAGLLVAPDAPDRFAAALRQMLSDAPVRAACAKAAQAAAQTAPRWDETAEIIAQALARLPDLGAR